MTQPYTLSQLSQEIHDGTKTYPKHILLWGPPRSGKTHLAATAVTSPHIERVYWFDLEKGLETLLYAQRSDGSPLLSPESLSKIIPISIPDSSENPYAAETILKTFRPGMSQPKIDQATGRVSPSGSMSFNLKNCGPKDLVVVDSLSQLGDSILSLSLNSNTYKDLRKYYGDFTLDMMPILTAIQSTNTNILCTTHTIDQTKMVIDPMTRQSMEKLLGTYPLCGSRNFSKGKVGKYFNYLLYTYTQGTQYRVTETPGHVSKIEQVGCRRHVGLIDDDGQPSLTAIFDPQAEEVSMAKQSSGPAIRSLSKS